MENGKKMTKAQARKLVLDYLAEVAWPGGDLGVVRMDTVAASDDDSITLGELVRRFTKDPYKAGA